jgi:very-short-patch-repair endonuclease
VVMTDIYNQREHTSNRQEIRNNATPIERIFWARLKGSQMLGLKFRRQYGIGPFVVDFYCPAVKLAIELDGESHRTEEAVAKTLTRQAYIESFGVTVLRFSNEQVVNDIATVLEQIESAASNLPGMTGAKSTVEPHPNPPLTKGRE